MPAPLWLRIMEQYMAKRADGLSQQVAVDAADNLVRSAQRIDRVQLQPKGNSSSGAAIGAPAPSSGGPYMGLPRRSCSCRSTGYSISVWLFGLVPCGGDHRGAPAA